MKICNCLIPVGGRYGPRTFTGLGVDQAGAGWGASPGSAGIGMHSRGATAEEPFSTQPGERAGAGGGRRRQVWALPPLQRATNTATLWSCGSLFARWVFFFLASFS